MKSRGKAAPDLTTKQRLFAASAGYCQNPGCNVALFEQTGSQVVHVAELAHIIAASDDGPRSDVESPVADRGAFENLIVLCSACHTKIDKADADFPPDLLRQWKASHQGKLHALFGAEKLSSRSTLRGRIEPLLAENHALFKALNPDLPYAENPESELATKWQAAVRERILPNNQRVLAYLDVNREHLTDGEKMVVEELRQHVNDLAMRHLSDVAPADQKRFPSGMDSMLKEQ